MFPRQTKRTEVLSTGVHRLNDGVNQRVLFTCVCNLKHLALGHVDKIASADVMDALAHLNVALALDGEYDFGIPLLAVGSNVATRTEFTPDGRAKWRCSAGQATPGCDGALATEQF